ncbi:MAG: hypothetical protein IH959_08740 [Chloroflexi bacterium]|nr:hypothetical protein [Chloroflexota bacterium]
METRKEWLTLVRGFAFVLLLAALLAASQFGTPAGDAQDPSDGGAMSLSIENFAGNCDGDRCVLELGSEFDLVVSIDGVPYNPEAPEDGFLLGSCGNGRDDGGDDGADAADASHDCTGYLMAQSLVGYSSYDAAASEDGAGTGSCGDGLDNGKETGPGIGTDRADEDCFEIHLVYKGDGTESEIESTKNCGTLVVGQRIGAPQGVELGLVTHSCLSGTSLTNPQPDTYTGRFITLAFDCSDSASTTEVALLPIGDPAVGGTGAGFVHSDGVTQFPASDVLTITCGESREATSSVTQPNGQATTQPIAQTPTAIPSDDGEPPEQDDSSGTNYGIVIGVIAAIAAGALALGAAWYTWRRRRREP